MKKKIMSLVLSFALLFGLLPATANAAVMSQGTSVTVSNPFSSMTVQGRAQDALYDVYASKSAANYEKQLQVGMTVTYTQNDVNGKDYDPGRIFPITVSAAGVIGITANVTFLQKENITIELYMDAACANRISYGVSLYASKMSSVKYFAVPNAGTYYLRVSTYNSTYSPATFQNSIALRVGFYRSGDMSLVANKMYYLGAIGQDAYYKISVPKTSYVTLSTNAKGNERVRYEICNSAKSIIYSANYLNPNYGNKHTYKLAKGTYYIKVKSYEAEAFTLKYALTGDYSASNNKWTTIYAGTTKLESYVKIKPTVNGYISIYPYGGQYYGSSFTVTLCNSSKKALTDDEYISAGSKYFGKTAFSVKKNTTYYLRVKGVYDRAAVKYVQTGVNEKSGSSKKKAVTVKQNKTIKGTIAVNDSKADWYKIKVPKTKKVKIYVSGNASGSLRMQVYKSNGKKYGYENTFLSDNNQSRTLESNGKMTKGTYYIKIYRANSKSSGNYSLKWK